MMNLRICLIFVTSNIFSSHAILTPSNICSSLYNGLTNLNDVLQIGKREPRFSNLFNLTFEGDHVKWSIISYTTRVASHTSYQNVVASHVYPDLIIAFGIFNTELYIDIDLSMYIPISLCGQSIKRTVGLAEGSPKEELCKLIITFRSPFPNLHKVRFSQNLGQNIKLYEYYGSDLILYTISNSSTLLLSKLIFLYNPDANFSNNSEKLGFNANFHNCLGSGVSRHTSTKVLWPTKILYEGKRLLLQKDYICDTVVEKGIYNLAYGNESLDRNKIIKELKLVPKFYRNYYVSSKSIFMELHGYFNLFKLRNIQSYILFEANMTKIVEAFTWKQLNITLNQFSINMTQFVRGQCSLVIQNFVTGIIETYIFYPHEKFNLTQTSNGIIGYLTSNLQSTSTLGYPNFFIVQVTCDTIEKIANNVFEVTPYPLLRLDRELVKCQI